MPPDEVLKETENYAENAEWKNQLRPSTTIHWMSIKKRVSSPEKPQVRKRKTAKREEKRFLFALRELDPNQWRRFMTELPSAANLGTRAKQPFGPSPRNDPKTPSTLPKSATGKSGSVPFQRSSFLQARRFSLRRRNARVQARRNRRRSKTCPPKKSNFKR